MTTTAKVVADSVNPDGVRITTLQLHYAKMIHGEFLTHRVFSRNSSSSRAIPVERLIQDVLDDPVMPSFWGSNKPGMQAGEEINTRLLTHPFGRETHHDDGASREEAWLHARNQAIAVARAFSGAGYHKQIVNRLIEPWCHINTVVTSTKWNNFFRLRCHPDAQPEMRMLAEAMSKAMTLSVPRELEWGQWHLPYYVYEEKLDPFTGDELVTRMCKVSVARCARVSYLTHDQKQTTVEEDLKLFDRLVKADPPHLSPTEHQAQAAMPNARNGRNLSTASNFNWSWLQYRKLVEQEQDAGA